MTHRIEFSIVSTKWCENEQGEFGIKLTIRTNTNGVVEDQDVFEPLPERYQAPELRDEVERILTTEEP